MLSFAILLLFALWVVDFAGRHPELLQAFRRVEVVDVVLLVALTLAMFLTNGLYTKLTLQAFDVTISVGEVFLLAAGTTAANYLLPIRGGAGIRAVYLKARHRFPLTDFASALSALYLLALLVNGVLGLASVALLRGAGRPFDPWLGALFAGVALLAGALVLFMPALPERGPRPVVLLARILSGWSRLRAQRGLLASLVAVVLASAALTMVQTRVAFAAFDVALPLADVLFFSAAKGIAVLATLTPGALGIVEWLSVYMAGDLRFTGEEGLLAQALMRGVTVGCAFLLAPVGIRVLGLRYRDSGDASGEQSAA